MTDLVKKLRCNDCRNKADCGIYAVIKDYYCNFESNDCRHQEVHMLHRKCEGCKYFVAPETKWHNAKCQRWEDKIYYLLSDEVYCYTDGPWLNKPTIESED